MAFGSFVCFLPLDCQVGIVKSFTKKAFVTQLYVKPHQGASGMLVCVYTGGEILLYRIFNTPPKLN